MEIYFLLVIEFEVPLIFVIKIITFAKTLTSSTLYFNGETFLILASALKKLPFSEFWDSLTKIMEQAKGKIYIGGDFNGIVGKKKIIHE